MSEDDWEDDRRVQGDPEPWWGAAWMIIVIIGVVGYVVWRS